MEKEIKRWNGFRKTLRVEDLIPFNKMMKTCKVYASAGGMAMRPILTETMFMSILLSQQRELMEIVGKLEQLEKLLRKA